MSRSPPIFTRSDTLFPDTPRFRSIFGGAFVLGLRLDLGKLGDAVHQPGDILPEQPEYLLRRGDGVLDRVVKDRGRDRLVVEVEVGQYARDLDQIGRAHV